MRRTLAALAIAALPGAVTADQTADAAELMALGTFYTDVAGTAHFTDVVTRVNGCTLRLEHYRRGNRELSHADTIELSNLRFQRERLGDADVPLLISPQGEHILKYFATNDTTIRRDIHPDMTSFLPTQPGATIGGLQYNLGERPAGGFSVRGPEAPDLMIPFARALAAYQARYCS